MHRAFLVQCDSAIEGARRTEQPQPSGRAVIALVGLVDVSLGQNEHLGADRVPLDLRPLCFEERLLTGRRGRQSGQTINLDARRLSLN